MPKERLLDSSPARGHTLADLQRLEKPTVRILLYTDDPLVTDDQVADWGLGMMIAHVHARPSLFFNVGFDLINRNSDPQHPAKHKLYRDLISKYDQIWFFGVHQTNLRHFSTGVLRGGPDSELDPDEVKALTEWMAIGPKKYMKGGGVLMTGDHNNPPPGTIFQPPDCGPGVLHEDYLGLGRALGSCVPRAGLLRKWKGPPTTCIGDSFNSLVLSFGTDPHAGGLEIDPVPQQLILRTFDESGKPIQAGEPHPLFFYQLGKWIQVFPDHVHEGAVILPDNFDDWPIAKTKTHQPRPVVVAYGIDKRNAQLLNMVAAYNGDDACVGRIVADSTWHHYFNKNLERFRPVGETDSPADLIGRYYANLVLWLSPRKARYESAHAMIHWLSHHPMMVEEAGFLNPNVEAATQVGEAVRIGRTAFSLLSQVASPCEIHELLQVLIPESDRGEFESLYFPDKASTLSYLPSKELFIGTLVGLYRYKRARIESSGDKSMRSKDVMDEVVSAGFTRALRMQFHRLSLAANSALEFNNSMSLQRS